MVAESSFWKEPLLMMADRIEVIAKKDCLTDRQYAGFERDIFIGFFSIRKLMDTVPKLTREVYDRRLLLRRYSRNSNSKPFDDWNKPDWHEFFDMENYETVQRDIRFVANQFIHSHLFIPSAEGEDHSGRLDPDGIFFASDRLRHTSMFFIETTDVVSTFRLVGSNYPSSVRMIRDAVNGERNWQIPEV